MYYSLLLIILLAACKSTGSRLSGGDGAGNGQPEPRSSQELQKNLAHQVDSQDAIDAFTARRLEYFKQSKDMNDYFWRITGDEFAYGSMKSTERGRVLNLWIRQMQIIFEDGKAMTYQPTTFTMADKVWRYCAALSQVEQLLREDADKNLKTNDTIVTGLVLAPLAWLAMDPSGVEAGISVTQAAGQKVGLYIDMAKLKVSQSYIIKKARMAMRADKAAGLITAPYRSIRDYFQSEDADSAGEPPAE